MTAVQPTTEELQSLKIAQLLTVVAVLARDFFNERPYLPGSAERVERLDTVFDFEPSMEKTTYAALPEIVDQLIQDLERNMEALKAERECTKS